MTKKRNFFSKLISCTLLAAMLLASALPMLAAGPVYTTGTSRDNEAEAVITKVLKMPIDTPTPAVDYTFEFTKVSATNSITEAQMPNLGTILIQITEDKLPLTAETNTTEGYIKVAKQSADIMSVLHQKAGGSGVQWPKEGIYTYTLSEKSTAIFGPDFDADKEGYSNSTARYEIEFWVEKDGDGRLYVKYFSAKTMSVTEGDRDEYYPVDPGNPGDFKVNPEEGDEGGNDGEDGNGTIADDFSQLIFTNKYWKTDGEPEGPEDPDDPNPDPDSEANTLSVKKIITGNGADLEQRFAFTVKVERPSIIPAGTGRMNFVAYVVNEASVDNTKNITDSKHGGNQILASSGENYIIFTSGSAQIINLTNEEKLVFADLYIGSNVEVKEKVNSDYVPAYERTFSTNAGTFKGSKNAEYHGFPGDEDPGKHFTTKGLNKNNVIYTNTREGATPTGISVDNLPYLVLIGIAVAGLLGFVVVKSRRNAEYEA